MQMQCGKCKIISYKNEIVLIIQNDNLHTYKLTFTFLFKDGVNPGGPIESTLEPTSGTSTLEPSSGTNQINVGTTALCIVAIFLVLLT